MSEELIEKIANDLVTVGYNNTMSGNYHFSFEDVAEMYGLSVETVIENKQEIADAIDKHEEILSETWIDEDFDMNFCVDDSEEE